MNLTNLILATLIHLITFQLQIKILIINYIVLEDEI